LALLAAPAPAAAVEYQINFRDGTSLRTSRVSQVDGQIRYEKFGGEASVAVGEVATVYVVEKDGTVSWVMEPRRDGTPPPPLERKRQPQPHVAAHARGTTTTPAATTSSPAPLPAAAAKANREAPHSKAAAATPTPSPPTVVVATGAPAEKAAKEAPTATGTPAPPAAPSAETSPPPDAAPPPPHGKVVLTPSEPLTTRLLRWGGAPLGALVALGIVVLLFRRRFRAAQKGVPVEAPVGGDVEVDFSVPSKAWETLTVALEERNFDVYRLCWVLNYSDEDLEPAFQKGLINWKYYDYTITKAEPHPKNKARFYLHIKRSTKFDREDLEERVKRMSLLRTDGGWKFEEVPYGF